MSCLSAPSTVRSGSSAKAFHPSSYRRKRRGSVARGRLFDVVAAAGVRSPGRKPRTRRAEALADFSQWRACDSAERPSTIRVRVDAVRYGVGSFSPESSATATWPTRVVFWQKMRKRSV